MEPRIRRASGFSLVEALVVIAVLSILLGFGLPELQKQIVKTRLQTFTQQVQGVIQKARSEAIRRQAVVVVEFDPVAERIFAFADLNGATLAAPPNLEFNQIGGQRRYTTDFEIATIQVEQNLDMAAPAGQQVIDGFTDNGRSGQVLVILPNGSVADVGALRIADEGGKNFLELRIEPAATARIQLRKWHETDRVWKARRQDGEPWEWKL
jgi:prepilin-type N-terminal cleavage/methylation domain-containing protein